MLSFLIGVLAGIAATFVAALAASGGESYRRDPDSDKWE